MALKGQAFTFPYFTEPSGRKGDCVRANHHLECFPNRRKRPIFLFSRLQAVQRRLAGTALSSSRKFAELLVANYFGPVTYIVGPHCALVHGHGTPKPVPTPGSIWATAAVGCESRGRVLADGNYAVFARTTKQW